MNAPILFVGGLAITLVTSVSVVIYLKSSLQKILAELCGSPERAAFWTSFSSVATHCRSRHLCHAIPPRDQRDHLGRVRIGGSVEMGPDWGGAFNHFAGVGAESLHPARAGPEHQQPDEKARGIGAWHSGPREEI